jgi:hypothetical protein
VNKKYNTKVMSKKVTLNKIPITALLEVLNELFEEGVDYIDLHGEPKDGKENDVLKVTVRPEYFVDFPNVEFKMTVKEVKEKSSPFSDEDDINDLI